MKISMLGIPWDKKSSFLEGSSNGPDHIRRVYHNGSSNYFSECGKYFGPDLIKDHGNIHMDKYEDLVSSLEPFFLQKNGPYIFLGGDHSITYPIVKGLNSVVGDFHMLHIDAHADLYDEFEGDRFSHACPMARIMEDGLVASMTQIGIRTLNDHQRAQAKKYGVKMIEMKDWDIESFEIQGPLYISLDLDAFEPGFAPGVSHHEPGGFSPREIIGLIQKINVSIIGADIVEYNPVRDFHEMTATLACKLIKEIAAKMIS